MKKTRTFFGFLDLLFQMLFIMMILPHHPEIDAKATQPGTLAVEMVWPAEMNNDVDLWVKAPGDNAVGYQNRSGRVFNLLRDDVGWSNDRLKLNFENAYTRGVPPGEYIVNVHLYSNLMGADEVPVDVRIYQQVEGFIATATVWSGKVILTYIGQEITVIRFTIGEDGFPLQDSFHNLPKKLKTGGIGNTP